MAGLQRLKGRKSLSIRRRLPAGGLALAAFIAGGLFGASAAAQVDSTEIAAGPVAIRRYQLLAPYEMAGSGIDPEVEVRVEIDAAGVVSAVEVLAIRPSSEFDDLLRHHVERAIADWRYGPARDEDDNAVASTLSWRTKFRSPVEDQGGSDRMSALDPQLDVLVSARALPAPPAQPTVNDQFTVLNRIVEVAEKYVDGERRRRRETDRFILVSDAEDETTVDILAGNMEAVFGFLHQTFDPHIEPLPGRLRILVFLLSSQDSLTRLQAELGGRIHGGGFYHPPGLLAFHQETHYFDGLLHTMIHEAFHAFSDTRLTGPGASLPLWAEEGTAEYFANSRIERGRIVPGKVDRGHYALVHGGSGVVRQQSLTTWNLKTARAAVREGEAPPIAELFETTADTFYGEHARQYYGFSWLLTHFLQHGRDDWENEPLFARMLLYLTEGYASRDALEAVFQVTPEALQAEFDRYVRRLR